MMFDEHGNLVEDWRDVGYINTTSATIQEIKEKEEQTHMGYDCSSFTLYVATEDLQKEIAEYSKRSSVRSAKTVYTPIRILRSGPATIVFWEDGTKTVVKFCAGETEDSAYAAFTAALAIKIFGSNSKLKKIVKTLTEEQK